jgi:phosphoglycolate phosphatase
LSMRASLKIRLAVFDCDGTLVDGQHSIIASMNQVFEAYGLAPPSADAVRHVVGLPLREAIIRLLPDAGEVDHSRLENGYVEAYSALRRKGAVNDPLFPGAVETLDALDRAGWILGIATGKGRRGLLATLESHGIVGRFANLQTSDRGPGKPNPHMLLNAMSETGAVPADTVMIGDTVYDMEMARRAGTMAVGVAWGYHPQEQLRRAGAHAVAQKFLELPDKLADLEGNAR